MGIAYRGSTCTFKQLSIHNPEGYEVLAALGTIPGHSRKMLVVAVYMPPGDTASRGNGCLDFLEDLMVKFKRKYSNPYIVFGSDFNQWRVEDLMANFIEMAEVDVGPTRGSRCIDRTFTNFEEMVTDFGSVPPLETDDLRKSDHRITFTTASLQRTSSSEWVTYSYRYYNKASTDQFGDWVMANNWGSVLAPSCPNQKADAYQAEVNDAIEQFFPLQTTKKKSGDLPWVNHAIRKRVKQRKAVYRREGRSAAW